MKNILKSTILGCSIAITFVSTSLMGIAPSSAQTKKDVTVFACIQQGENYATIAKRDKRATPPIIIWKDTSFGDNYPPKKRCEIVSSRLSKAVAEQGGRLRTLKLTHGKIGSNSIICYISHPNDVCTSKNILLTLKSEDRGQEKAIIEQLVSLKVTEQPLMRGSNQKRTIASFTEIENFLNGDTLPERSPAPSPTTPILTNP